MIDSTDLAVLVEQVIRNIPDFPKPGIQFKDISPLLRDTDLTDRVGLWLANQGEEEIDAVVALDARGFIFGILAAAYLDVPFVMCRKAGKLPGETVGQTYDLEYGSATVEIQTDSISNGDRVAVIDDLLATGGTAMAAVDLIRKMGGSVKTCAFLIELDGLGGREKLEDAGVGVYSLVTYGD